MRILFFLQPGGNSRSIFLDMIRGFQAAGHESVIMELAPVWAAYQQAGPNQAAAMSDVTRQVAAVMTEQNIDAAACMWGNALTTLMHGMNNGRPETVFDSLNVPLLCYWLDAPHWAQGGSMHAAFGSPILRSPVLLNTINNVATAQEMRDILGFGRVVTLPYAVDPEIFAPREGAKEFDLVASIGPGDPAPTPLALGLLDDDDPPLSALREEAALAIASALPGLTADRADAELILPVLNALLAAQRLDRHESMITRLRKLVTSDAAKPEGERSLAEGVAALVADPTLYVRATGLIRGVESMRRAFIISWLSRRFSMLTFGAGDLSAWGCKATHLGEVPYDQMAAAYSRGRLGLNVMRWQDDEGLNLKPFEISASGIACLCGQREGAESAFNAETEIAFFDGPAHAAKLARELLDDEPRRTAMATAARSRILKEHTWKHRATQLAAELQAARASRWSL